MFSSLFGSSIIPCLQFVLCVCVCVCIWSSDSETGDRISIINLMPMMNCILIYYTLLQLQQLIWECILTILALCCTDYIHTMFKFNTLVRILSKFKYKGLSKSCWVWLKWLMNIFSVRNCVWYCTRVKRGRVRSTHLCMLACVDRVSHKQIFKIF